MLQGEAWCCFRSRGPLFSLGTLCVCCACVVLTLATDQPTSNAHFHSRPTTTAFLTKDKLILVLEYCQGGELFEHLAGEGPYSEKAASEMVKQMASVLQFLHAHNCTHRDLKPENILLTNNGSDPVIKVADFGLATMKQGPFMTSVCGTWAYCAPEVKKKKKTTTHTHTHTK